MVYTEDNTCSSYVAGGASATIHRVAVVPLVMWLLLSIKYVAFVLKGVFDLIPNMDIIGGWLLMIPLRDGFGTECGRVPRNVVVIIVVVVLLFYVHSKHLWSCRDDQFT